MDYLFDNHIFACSCVNIQMDFSNNICPEIREYTVDTHRAKLYSNQVMRRFIQRKQYRLPSSARFLQAAFHEIILPQQVIHNIGNRRGSQPQLSGKILPRYFFILADRIKDKLYIIFLHFCTVDVFRRHFFSLLYAVSKYVFFSILYK